MLRADDFSLLGVVREDLYGDLRAAPATLTCAASVIYFADREYPSAGTGLAAQPRSLVCESDDAAEIVW